MVIIQFNFCDSENKSKSGRHKCGENKSFVEKLLLKLNGIIFEY